jgi:hypothetical protein
MGRGLWGNADRCPVRKLLRYLRYLVDAAVAVLCVIVAAVWVASYFRYDTISYEGEVVKQGVAGGAFEQRVFTVRYDEGRCALAWLALRADAEDDLAGRAFWPSWHGFRWTGRSHAAARTSHSNAWGPGVQATNSWAHYWFRFVHNGGTLFTGLTYDERKVEIPLWALLLPPLLWTIFAVRSYRRKRARERVGHCRKCGYDLRASKDACPECGAPVKVAARQGHG